MEFLYARPAPGSISKFRTSGLILLLQTSASVSLFNILGFISMGLKNQCKAAAYKSILIF